MQGYPAAAMYPQSYYQPQYRPMAHPQQYGMRPPFPAAAMQYGAQVFTPRQGQAAWTPPPQQGQAAAASSPAVRKDKPKKKRTGGLAIIDPSTKQQVTASPTKEKEKEEPAAAEEAGADGVTTAAAGDTSAKAAQPIEQAVAAMTPNSRRKRAVAIKNPKDGSVINEDAPQKKAEPEAAPRKSEPAKAEPAKAEPAKTEPAKTKAAEPKAAEPAAPEAAEPAALAPSKGAPPPSAEANPAAPKAEAAPAPGGGYAAIAAKPAAPTQAAPAAATPADGAVAANAPSTAVVYGEGQWSPSNPEGAKVYSKEFLAQFKRMGCSAPESFRHGVIQVQQRGGGSQGRNRQQGGGSNNFNVGYLAGGDMRSGPSRSSSGGARGGGGMGHMSRGSGGRNRPAMISLGPREAPKLNKTENRYVPSAQKQGAAKADKSMLEQARSILNKLTLEKFDKLSKSLLSLALGDLDQLSEFTEMIFQKAVDEPFFCVVYSKLCRSLHDMVKESNSTTTRKGTTDVILVASYFKSLLLANCQKQFDDAEADAKKEREAEKAAIAKAESTEEIEKIKKMPRSEREKYEMGLREEKREAKIRVAKVRRHIIGNITFIGELFLVDMVPEKIMNFCVDKLLESAQDASNTKEHREESLEQLCKLFETAGSKLERKVRKKKGDKKNDSLAVWEGYFKQLDKIAKNKDVPSRIRFGIQDILDMRKAGWEARNTKKGPKTIEEIHQEAKEEQQMNILLTERHQARGGSGQFGRGSRGRPPVAQPQISRDDWVAVQRKGQKVDSNMFASLAGAPGGGGKAPGLRLGGPKPKLTLGKTGPSRAGGAAANGTVEGGRYVRSSSNQFSVLDQPTKAKSSRQEAAAPKAHAEPAAAAAAADGKPNFPPDIMDKKINGTLNEYFSIKLIDEVKQSLDDWGRVNAVYLAFCGAALRKLEALKTAERDALMGLFKLLTGADRGVPVGPMIQALEDFFEEMVDIVCDAPKLPDYVGEFIAAAIIGSSKSLRIMEVLTTDNVQQILYGDLPLKIALAAYKAIKTSDGEAKAVALYTESKVPLSKLFPGDEERVKDLTDRAGMLCLLEGGASPGADGADFGVKVEEMVRSGVSCKEVQEFVAKQASAEALADGSASAIVTTALISGVTSKTTLAAGTAVNAPAKEAEDMEGKELASYTSLLESVAEKEEAQLAAVVAVAQFAASKGFPKGMVNRLFFFLYEVVDEEVFKRFKADKKIEQTMPKKTIVVQQAENFYQSLDQPAE